MLCNEIILLTFQNVILMRNLGEIYQIFKTIKLRSENKLFCQKHIITTQISYKLKYLFKRSSLASEQFIIIEKIMMQMIRNIFFEGIIQVSIKDQFIV